MSAWVWVHVACMLLSYVAFLAAFVSGLLFLWEERQLKRRPIAPVTPGLPSLGMLDRFNLWAIGAGSVLLTLGTALGVLGTRRVVGTWWLNDPKEVLTAALWFWYILLWLVRLRSTLRGRRVALLSVMGFGFVILAGLGAELILSSVHPFGRP